MKFPFRDFWSRFIVKFGYKSSNVMARKIVDFRLKACLEYIIRVLIFHPLSAGLSSFLVFS